MRHTLARWSVVPLLLAACSHDATRVNPLDAELTPPVQLTVDLDDTTGVATLSWGAYAGSIPFGEYVVLRQVQGLVAADTLVRLTDVQATAHADSTIRHGASYLYRVLVVNSGGLTVSSESVSSPTLSLRAPRIVTLDASSVTASIYVGWQRFRGPGFQQYRITRDDGVSTQTIHTTSDTTDTSHVDTALRGSTTYRYRVEVETERGLAVGDWAEDGFHQVVDTWHLPVQQVGFNTEQVRLSVGESGWLQAFMTAPSRLVTFDAQGVVRSEQSMPRSAGGGALPSTTVRPDGDRLVLVPGAARPVAAVLLLDDAGNAETTIHDLSEHLADLGITPQDIQGRIGLVGSGGQHYHDIKVTSGLRTLFADDFGSLPIGELAPEDLSGWIFRQIGRAHV